MDILAYEDILDNLKAYNASLTENYGNTIVSLPPTNPTYPLTRIDEVRNVANSSYNTCYERLSSVGYRVIVDAKDKGKISRQTIARRVCALIDRYFTNIGLTRISFNITELQNNGSIFRIIVMYSGNLDEHRRRFI